MSKRHYINTETDHSPRIRRSTFRFYEELNDHWPKRWKHKKSGYEFKGHPLIKNSIQSIGVPHSEVDLIMVNGESVDFNYKLAGDEDISVYPVFESLDISPIIKLRPLPLRLTRFIVDVNLGKLAQKLRLLGFDTLFRNDFEDDEIVRISLDEKRIILTRDRGILKQNAVTHGYWLRNDDPKKQLSEVINRFQLQNNFKPFSRCSTCNGLLVKTTLLELRNKLPNDTLMYYNDFWECNICSKIYWKGSHFDHILKWLNELREQ